MVLTEEAAIPATALPLAELRDHLRLGSGFGEDGLQDGLVDAYLRAALAAIEGRIGKALIARAFRWAVDCWREPHTQALPVAPVQSVSSLTLFDAAGAATVISPTSYRLIADLQRPRLAAVGSALPAIPSGGRAEVRFVAGFGVGWFDVPADLRQAVLLLAAEYYDNRSQMGLREQMLPFGIMALIERWRTVRVLGGGRHEQSSPFSGTDAGNPACGARRPGGTPRNGWCLAGVGPRWWPERGATFPARRSTSRRCPIASPFVVRRPAARRVRVRTRGFATGGVCSGSSR